jgi:hypothetical protein
MKKLKSWLDRNVPCLYVIHNSSEAGYTVEIRSARGITLAAAKQGYPLPVDAHGVRADTAHRDAVASALALIGRPSTGRTMQDLVEEIGWAWCGTGEETGVIAVAVGFNEAPRNQPTTVEVRGGYNEIEALEN